MQEEILYYILDTEKDKKRIQYPDIIKLLPSRWRQRAEEKYRCKELPVLKEPVDFYGTAGIKIEIPYTFYELQEFSEDEIESIFERIIQREAVQNIVAKERLKKYLPKAEVVDGNLIPVLYINEAIQWICKEHQILKKDLHLVLVDSGGQAAGFILSHLKLDLNHLTIVTGRSEFFDNYVEFMQKETGLLATILPLEVGLPVEGNVVLDLCQISEEEYQVYPVGSVVMQLFYDKVKTRSILAHRKDVTCYNQLHLESLQGIVDNKVFQAVLCGKQRFITGNRLERMYAHAQNYGFTVEKLGVKI